MSMTVSLIISLFFSAMCAVVVFCRLKEIHEETVEYATERFVNIGLVLAELREALDAHSEQIKEISVIDDDTAKSIIENFNKSWEASVEKIMNYDPFKGDSE